MMATLRPSLLGRSYRRHSLESASQFAEGFLGSSAARAFSSTTGMWSVWETFPRNPIWMTPTLKCTKNWSRRLAPSGSITTPHHLTQEDVQSDNTIITTLKKTPLKYGSLPTIRMRLQHPWLGLSSQLSLESESK